MASFTGNRSERTPLLDGPIITGISGHRDSKQCIHEISTLEQYKEEAKTLLKYTLPVYGSYILEYSLVISAVIAIGHISPTALAASALASMTAGVTGFSIVQGFASALDTVLPSAWTSMHPEYVGLWTHRMGIVMTMILIPISFIWFHAETILLHLKQDPEVASLAGLYLRWMVLCLPAEAFNAVARKYFQSQGLLNVPTKVFMCTSPFNAVLMYLLVWGPAPIRLGFVGAPIATIISTNTASLSFLIYAMFFTPSKAWHPICRRSFTNLPLMFKLGLAGVAQVASDWWCWELVALAASFLGPLYLATQSVLLVSASTMCMAPLSLSMAASVRIGNLLGEQNAHRASISAKCTLLLAFAFALINGLVIMTFRKSWGKMFNNDPDVVALVAEVLPLAALFQIGDGVTMCCGGILRASNKLMIGAIVNVTAYYIIGIPFGIWLAFNHDMKLFGLWFGLAAALVYSSTFGSYLCLSTDWDLEVEKVLVRHSAEHALNARIDSEESDG